MNEIGAVKTRRPGFFYRMMMSFLGLFDRWLHLSCRSFTQLASEKYERPLGRSERLRQAMHRLMCGMCRRQERHMDQLHSLIREVGSKASQVNDVNLCPEAADRIEQALNQALRKKTDPDGKGEQDPEG